MLQSLVEMFSNGGIWMWVILALQVTTIFIMIERAIFLYRTKKVDQYDRAMSYEMDLRKGHLEETVERCSRTEEPIDRAVAAGAQAAMSLGGRDQIQGKMDEILLNEKSVFERRTGFLAVLANVATLTGLLGTITGMIQSFAALANASPAEKATLLSNGIAQAMNTTAYGLVVAIPALIMYAILANRTSQLVTDLNRGALTVFNWLSYDFNPVNVKKVSK